MWVVVVVVPVVPVATMDTALDAFMAVDTPMHDRLDALERAMRTVDEALTSRRAFDPGDDAVVARFHRWTERTDVDDDTLFVQRNEPVSTTVLAGLVRLRLDLARHEPTWRHPQTGRFARLALDDVVPSTLRSFFEPVWTTTPVLFWSMRSIVALLGLMLEHRRHLPLDAVVRPLVTWASRRMAMLLTYTFDGTTTHDVPTYRTTVERHVKAVTDPLRTDGPSVVEATGPYRASMAAVWDAVALLRPLWHWTAPTVTDVVVVAPSSVEKRDDVVRFTTRVVARMQGDTLPLQYQRTVVDAAVRPHHAAWFRRRRPRAHAPRSMDLLQECTGTAFAAHVHARATRRLRDVVASDPLEPALVEACAAYYAVQKRLPDVTASITWSLPHQAYAVMADDDDTTVTLVGTVYADAVAYACAQQWPEGELVGTLRSDTGTLRTETS